MWKGRTKEYQASCKDSKATTARGPRRRKLRKKSFSEMKKSTQLPTDKREAVDDSSTSTTSTPSPVVFSTESSSEVSELQPSAKKLTDIEDARKWTFIQTRGAKPVPRFNHAAAVVGRKLLVIGGEDGCVTRNDVQMLHLGKLSWSKIGVGDSAPSKGLPTKTGPAQELPNCKGHSLVTWGKTVILIGGQSPTSPEDKISVWSFDLELDCWRSVVTKGEIPTARSGQTVTRAGSILIMFGGEDAKGRKLNDLSILDLKSLMWLPLHPTGKSPSPRARHVADMYDDRFLFIFGGETKSKISNDIFALDFDNMEWSRLKTRGVFPVPRAGHAGALVGSMWYIVGGESRTPGPLDTTVLDMSRMEWSVVAPASEDSASSLQGLSLLFTQRKDRRFLVAFGGLGVEPSNAVQVLHVPLPEHPPRKTLAGLLELPSTPEPKRSASRHGGVVRSQHGPQPTLMGAGIPCACVSVAKSNLDPVVERRSAIQQERSHPKVESYYSTDLDRNSGLIPLRTRYAMSQSSRMVRASEKSSSLTESSSSSKFERWPSSQPRSWDSISSTRRRDLTLPSLKSSRRLSASPDSEDCKRQHQGAQRNVKADFQSTPPPVDPGLLLSAEELQISGPSVCPGLLSLGDAGSKLFPQARASVSSGPRSCQGGSQSSEFSGYAETFVSRDGEIQLSAPLSTPSSIHASPSHVAHISNESQSPSKYSDKYVAGCDDVASPGLVEVEFSPSFRGRSPEKELDEIDAISEGGASFFFDGNMDMGEDEIAVITRIQTADSAEERRVALELLVQHQERKIAAAIRTGELLAGQCAEALRDRDEAERSVHIVQQSRQRLEGRLSAALKQIKELKGRLMVTEQAREESNVLVRNSRVENMKLEHDLALKTALLGESQKELQVTRGHLVAEGTRAFQLQVELINLKQKLQATTPRAAPLVQYMRQPILA